MRWRSILKVMAPAAVLLLLALPLGAAPQAPASTDTTDTAFPADTAVTDTTATDVVTETVTTEEVEPTETAATTTYYEDDDAGDDAEKGAAVCATCAAFGIVIPLILLGISIAIALWIYRDAKERGITSAPLWAILGFLFNILGLVIYLIARKNMQPPSSAPGSTMPPPPPPA